MKKDHILFIVIFLFSSLIFSQTVKITNVEVDGIDLTAEDNIIEIESKKSVKLIIDVDARKQKGQLKPASSMFLYKQDYDTGYPEIITSITINDNQWYDVKELTRIFNITLDANGFNSKSGIIFAELAPSGSTKGFKSKYISTCI